MTHDLALRALQLFEQAMELPDEQVETFLDESCANNAELRSEVEALLEAQATADDLLPTIHRSPDSTAASDSIRSADANVDRVQLGTRLAGRYRVTDVLGSGGMGDVYRSHDVRLDRDVAIKVLNQASLADQDMQDRFDREIRSVASLSHPNIVTLFDVANHGDFKFAVMELVEGKTLRELIVDGLDWQTTVELACGIATALGVAHARNIMHRDIKPENVIVSNSKQVKVLDFGIARPVSPTKSQDVTGTQLIPGTVPYMSPEQTNREELTCATDVFSLGTVVFEMLTGTNPFRGTGFLETMQNVIAASPPPISEFVSGVPDKLVSLVLVMLHRDPDRRPSAAQVAEDLSGILQTLSGYGTRTAAGGNTTYLQTAVPTNIPLRRIELTGRVSALEKVSDSLTSYPIVTVLGAGGVGKTSLALEIARSKLEEFPGGVWLCEFAPLRPTDDVAEVIAATLDGNAGSMSGIDEIVGQLLGPPTLLIFDNCEHVIDAVAELAERLSGRVPNLTILATSRESLDVHGEYVHRLDGLEVAGRTSASAELFVRRATALAGYEDEPHRRMIVEKIVTRLEGLPLAIELAAPKLSAMSLEELLAALDDQVGTLRSRRRSRDRQSTIDSAISWSFDLLAPDEQELLMVLSVFSAAFTSEAAIAVSGLPNNSKLLLQRLVDQSVVVRNERKGISRYRLLEPIRQFCQARIDQDVLDKASSRHARFYANRAKKLGRGVSGFDEIQCADALNAEWSDLRQAVAWGRSQRLVEIAVDPVIAMARTLMFHLRVEGYHWLLEAERLFGEELAERADALWVIANGAWVMGDLEKAETYILRSEQISMTPESLGVKYFLRFAQQRFDESFEAAEQAFQRSQSTNNDCELRWWSNALAACPLALGNPSDSRIDDIIAAATTFVSKLDWPSGEAFLFLAKATSAMTRGELENAFEFREHSIKVAEKCGNRWIALINRLVINDGYNPKVPPIEHLSTAVKNLRTLADLGEEAHYPLAVRSVIMAMIGCEQFELAIRSATIVSRLQGVGDNEEFTPQYKPTLDQVIEQLGTEAVERLQSEAAGITVQDVLKVGEHLVQTLS